MACSLANRTLHHQNKADDEANEAFVKTSGASRNYIDRLPLVSAHASSRVQI
jgi:hypothetical protein